MTSGEDLKPTVYTIGHSSRSLDELLELLLGHGVQVVVDVRRWPRSRRNPQYNMEELRGRLSESGIEYIWLGSELGGYRKLGVDAPDTGAGKCFKSEGFRAYAIYITTSTAAQEALERLAELAGSKLVAIMCSERLPWRCHRKIISDWLIARGFRVLHIIDREHVVEHKLTKCAEVVDGKLVYR